MRLVTKTYTEAPSMHYLFRSKRKAQDMMNTLYKTFKTDGLDVEWISSRYIEIRGASHKTYIHLEKIKTEDKLFY